MVQKGGSAQSAIDWYARKMQIDTWELRDTEDRAGHFAYHSNQRDSVIWYRDGVGAGTIAHEVHHAITRLADILEAPIDTTTDEVFAYYSGWLTGEIVNRLWA